MVADMNAVKLTSLTSCGGCAAKAGPAWLSDILGPLGGMFSPQAFPDLLVGLAGPDDAAIYRLSDDRAMVATVDFFPPLLDDPYTYGAVAAANALSDVFAMGGDVALALNVAAFPEDLPPEVVREILRGSADKVAEAGGAVAGGHTIWDAEPKFGLCAIGFVHPDRIFSKGGLRAGDALYLTKPVGTGMIISAVRDGVIDASHLAAAIDSMLRLNRVASERGRAAGVLAATDVTGFGVLGHAWEMAQRSGVVIEIAAEALPVLPGAREAAAAGVETSGGGRNRAWASPNIQAAPDVPADLLTVLFDPQTSGGLLIGCAPERTAVIEAEFAAAGEALHRIGIVAAGAPGVRVRRRLEA